MVLLYHMEKKIHQVWIGVLPPPLKWTQTWSEYNPDWEYRMWTNDDLSLQEMLKEEPPFFSTSDELVVTPLGKKILQELYPVPSRYEKSGQ